MGYRGGMKCWSGEATKVTWICLVVHGCMCMIMLYRVTGVIRVLTLHLGIVYGNVGMVNSTCDCVHGVLANVSCSCYYSRSERIYAVPVMTGPAQKGRG